MEYFCLNDRFAYCIGQPKKIERTEQWKVVPHSDNKNTGVENKLVPSCKLEIATCGCYQKASDKTQ